LVQEFDITIVDKPGKDNVVADFLSRLNTNDVVTPIEDSFPVAHHFPIYMHTPWHIDIANYLATRKVPHHLGYIEHQKIIHHSARYSWIEGYLFYTGPDQQI